MQIKLNSITIVSEVLKSFLCSVYLLFYMLLPFLYSITSNHDIYVRVENNFKIIKIKWMFVIVIMCLNRH